MAGRSNRQDLYLSVNGDVRGLEQASKAGRTILNEFAGTAVNVLEEVEKEFQKIGAGGPPAGLKEAERAYTETFRRIGASAREAAKAPTGQAAIQILDVNAAREAAEAATNKAAALRIVAEAASRADQATGGTSAATRAYAAAAATAAVQADAEAAALREQAGVLGTVESQLGRLGAAQARGRVISGQAKAGYQQLSYQLGDISMQYSLGTSASIIFAQQSGQVIQALQMIGGEGNKVLSFLGGGWGIAISSALVVATPFVAELFEGGDAAEQAKRSLAEHVTQLSKDAAEAEIAARANDQFATSVEGVTAALRKQNAELDESIKKKGRNAAELANIEQKEELERAKRAKTNADRALKTAITKRDELKRAPLVILPGDEGAAAKVRAEEIAAAEAAIEAARKKAAAAAQAVLDAEKTVNRTRVELAAETAELQIDSVKAVEKAYDDQIAAVMRAADADARAGKMIGKATQDRITALKKEKAAAVEAERARASATKEMNKAGPLTDFLSPVSGSVSGQFNEKRPRHQHAGIDYAVPAGTPVRAPAAGTIDVAGERQGYGNAIYINFGAGTTARFGHLSKFNVKPGDRVEAGDIIGYSGGEPGTPGAGNTTGAHLHYEVRRRGKAVDPRTGKFPTDAGGVGDSAAKTAEAAARREQAEQDRKTQNADAYANLLSQAKEAQYRIERSRTSTIAEAADLDVQAVERQRADLDRAVQKGVQLGRWTQAEADAVKLINEQNATAEIALIRERERDASITRRAQLESDALADQATLLRLQGDLASTAAERRAVARQLLKIEQDQQRIALQTAIDTERDPAKRAALQARYNQLPTVFAAQDEQLERQNDDPLQAYGRRLIETTNDMDEALKGIAANGFGALEDASSRAAASAITDLLKIRGVAGNVINGIINDLIRLAIQKAIVSAVGKSFFGLADGGLVSSATAGARWGADQVTPFVPDFSGYAAGGLPGYVDGQRIIRGPGTGRSDSILALVGGRDPILVSNGEGIVNERAVQQYWPLIDAMNKGTFPRFADGGLPGLPAVPRYPSIAAAQQALAPPSGGRPLVFDLRNAVITADLLRQMEQIAAETSGAVLREAAPTIVEAASNHTVARLRRPTI